MRHTTYEAEVVGMLLVLELICDVGSQTSLSTALVKLDNQAAILVLGGHKARPA